MSEAATQQSAPSTGSLIDPSKSTAEPQNPNATVELGANQAAEGDTAAVDTNGELILGKFKDYAALEGAYKNLESEFGTLRRQKSPEIPEKYEYNFSEDPDLKRVIPEGYDFSTDPMVQHLEPVFKDLKLTQEQVAGLTKAKIMFDAQNQIDPGEELKKLGPEGHDTIKAVETFVSRNLSPEEQVIAAQVASTAEGVKLLHKLSRIANTSIPKEAQKGPQLSRKELLAQAQEIRSQPRFDLDLKAKQQVEAIYRTVAEMDLKEKGAL